MISGAWRGRLALTEEDRLAAYRLRYEQYIAEQGKPYPDANHDERTLSDALDAEADIILVESAGGGVACGTVRANWCDSAATLARYSGIFDLSLFQRFRPAEISVCSRLAVMPGMRDPGVRDLLFQSIYERGLDRNTRLCFVACAPMLVRMFRRYGFRECLEPYSDPVVGKMHRLMLVIHDLEHLERVGSPFFDLAKRRAVTEAPAGIDDLYGTTPGYEAT